MNKPYFTFNIISDLVQQHYIDYMNNQNNIPLTQTEKYILTLKNDIFHNEISFRNIPSTINLEAYKFTDSHLIGFTRFFLYNNHQLKDVGLISFHSICLNLTKPQHIQQYYLNFKDKRPIRFQNINVFPHKNNYFQNLVQNYDY